MERVLERIVLHQDIVSPHMAGLASALAELGHEVTYCATTAMSRDRALLGWSAPDLAAARLELLPDERTITQFVDGCPGDAVHVCQGIRGNGMIAVVQRKLRARAARMWLVMEAVNDTGWMGPIKRAEYWRLFRRWEAHFEGILATGDWTAEWLAQRGVPRRKVFPFAYFLPDTQLIGTCPSRANSGPFRFLFVGQLIELKRLDWLIDAIADLRDGSCELGVVGSGPLERALRERALSRIGARRVRWIGRLPIESVQAEMALADCVVLPSRHEGWGAVISESLMVGTPVICSDACGAAGVVRASGRGYVFSASDRMELHIGLERAISLGRLSISEREALAAWAKCLGARVGAEYLGQVLACARNGAVARPRTPWMGGGQKCVA